MTLSFNEHMHLPIHVLVLVVDKTWLKYNIDINGAHHVPAPFDDFDRLNHL